MLELYKVILDEYRFQVNLNWERNKFYVLLNSGLITATCGLLRIPGFKFAEFLTLPLFALGLLCSWIGLVTLLKGVEYRRRIVYRKGQLERDYSWSGSPTMNNRAVEKQLADTLNIPTIDTTKGMREVPDLDLDEYLKRPPRLGTISSYLAVLFVLLMVLNAIALLTSVPQIFAL